MTVITRPAIVSRIGRHSGTHGIELDVPGAVEKIGVALNKRGPVSAFEQRTRPSVLEVKALNVVAAHVLHEMRDALVRRGRHQQVDMVCLEHPGVDRNTIFFSPFT